MDDALFMFFLLFFISFVILSAATLPAFQWYLSICPPVFLQLRTSAYAWVMHVKLPCFWKVPRNDAEVKESHMCPQCLVWSAGFCLRSAGTSLLTSVVDAVNVCTLVLELHTRTDSQIVLKQNWVWTTCCYTPSEILHWKPLQCCMNNEGWKRPRKLSNLGSFLWKERGLPLRGLSRGVFWSCMCWTNQPTLWKERKQRISRAFSSLFVYYTHQLSFWCF